ASVDIYVPQIVVLSSQNAGKSDLFEGISKVSLPRDYTRMGSQARLQKGTGALSSPG
ncbi:hypothetical protein FRC16_004025, partial [Serendipita sp. 398]